MNNNPINDSIQLLLQELKYIVEDLKIDTADTSQLELDLMKEKIRKIYDILCDVKIIKDQDLGKEVETITHPEPEKEPVQEKKKKPETVPELILEIEEAVEENVDNLATTKMEEKPPPLSEPTLNLFEEPISKPVVEKKKSIGEKIAEQKSIGEVIQSKKIVNLKLAIGINEKFFFLNELFEGKMNEYNDTIDMLDQKDTLKDAMEYLALLKENKNWEEESEAYQQLKGFLEKKFN